jgi:hypothetical protein
MEIRKFLMILTFAVLVIGAVIIWLYPSHGDFKRENPSWNGLSNFVDKSLAVPLKSYRNLPQAASGTSLVLIPYVKPSTAELEKLNQYVTQGGVLIILDDFGHGNDVLSYLQLRPRFYGQLLLDPVFNYRNKQLPRILDVANGEQKLVLNHATAISQVSEAEAIAWSSPFSFLDLNGDGEFSPGEPTGKFPVAARLKAGKGDIILIADPSILVNSMISMEDNYGFVQDCARIQNPAPKIVVDQLHLPETPLDESKSILGTIHDKLSIFWGILAMSLAVLLIALRPVWGISSQAELRKRR